MKILLISDKVSPVLYEHYDKDQFKGVDFVISCGDLPAGYLDFVATTLNVPCFFVPGNHDTAFVDAPPPGWILLDGRIIRYNGIVMMGLGGSKRYKPGPQQYTEIEMKWRFLKMKPGIWRNRNKIDILITHAPAYGLNDLDDLAHSGFKVFVGIINRYHPKYFFHGHVHLSYSRNPRKLKYGNTSIINCYEHVLIDYNKE